MRDNARTKAELDEKLEKESLFRTVFYEAGIGIALADLEGQVLAYNPALQRMLGYAAEELAALTIGQFSHPADTAIEVPLFQELLHGCREQYQMKKRYLHKDGHIVWGWLTVSLVRSAANVPQFAIGMVEDITEREQAEEARREIHARLQQTQQQLAQAAKLAAVGELAATVAHELNNPLSVILGYAELLLEECPSEDRRRKDLEAIAAEARRTRDIVRDLLGLSRRSRNRRVPADVNELVRQPLSLMHYQLEKSGIRIAESYADGLGPVCVDEGQIKQVFLNLIANAGQAMPAGGTLSVRTVQVDAGVSVAISDTGAGIPQENLAHMFEPFFSTKASGTGLGLAISQRLVQEHGGRITVESQEGQGSTFTVWLPLEPSMIAGDR